MQALSFERPEFAQAAVVSLLTLSAVALLGVVLAYWTWALLAPRPEPRAPAAVEPGSRIDSASRLFGNVQVAGNHAPRAGMVLLGVVAASAGGSGYAVLRLDAKQTVAVREGEEIEPGVRLIEVHANQIVLERGGTRETLDWPEPGAPAAAAAPLASR